MSKNIVIQEGGIGKQMTASKIKVNNVGGGTSLWVPEDETTLVTKNISKNGTYKATSDNAYGFSQVTVKVAGGDGSATSSGTPTTSNGVDPGGIGSSVIGRDPTDNNEYAVGIDSGGNIVKTKVPSGIEIGKVPDKTSYTEGETIDYSGIIVILKGGDGAMFSNSDYPNGRIPFNELVFPTTEAQLGITQVSVEWISPYSGKTFEKGFNITVSEVDTGLNWTADPSYLVHQAGTPLGSNNIGEYVKKNDGYAVALWEIRSDNNQLPIMMSGKIEYAQISPGTVYTVQDSSGNTWYLGTGFGEQGQGRNSGGLNTISSSYDYPGGYNNPLFVDLIISTCRIRITESGGSGYSDDSGGSESGGGGGF